MQGKKVSVRRRQALMWVGLAALAGVCLSASAVEMPPVAKQEVVQLLDRLAASGCAFSRNGSWHSAVEARKHLDRKYQYLLDKKLVGSADDFIALGATKSSTTGEPYQVKCKDGQPRPSAVWLTEELRAMRTRKQEASK